MRIFRFIGFCYIVAALPLMTVTAQTPQLHAESYILLDAETGTVLAEKNADLPLPPASLTKIMSTYVYFQAVQDGVLSLSQPITISEAAWGSKTAGSKMFIEVNTQVTVEDLLRGVIIQSGNDASIALAEAVAGDEDLFAEEMNRAADRLGLTQSRFKNSTGLPAQGHYSSARDIALLSLRTIQDFPDLYSLYAEKEFTYNNIRQTNRNGLLNTYAGTDGLKTGYTKAAGYCLAVSALRDGRRLIAVVMKTKSPRAREQASMKLLTYGFNRFHNVNLFSRDEARQLSVWEGAADEVRVQPAKNGIYTLPRGSRTALHYQPQTLIHAPVEKGQILGKLQVLVDDELLEEVDVVAAQAVASGSWWKRWLDGFKVSWLGHGSDNAVLSQW